MYGIVENVTAIPHPQGSKALDIEKGIKQNINAMEWIMINFRAHIFFFNRKRLDGIYNRPETKIKIGYKLKKLNG